MWDYKNIELTGRLKNHEHRIDCTQLKEKTDAELLHRIQKYSTLYATGTTGRLIEEASNLTVHKFLAGHLGGEQQLGAMIEQNEMDLIIYLREPLAPQKQDPDVKRIFMLCDTHNIPMATNLATAEMMIRSLGRGELDWREMYK